MEGDLPLRDFQAKMEKVVAIVDIDCSVKEGFEKEDQKQLEALARLIGKSCDW